ncbi:hypothetical protein Bca52824_022972 [Brassica carinata]|uniref:Uncharacterized protein n=1 Tax=Brassica carinata TaxID=52824 RepID=A0A8X7VI37_BRACI|nr:hypothetical protein Bca52824_022972 [Brassica carinata]
MSGTGMDMYWIFYSTWRSRKTKGSSLIPRVEALSVCYPSFRRPCGVLGEVVLSFWSFFLVCEDLGGFPVCVCLFGVNNRVWLQVESLDHGDLEAMPLLRLLELSARTVS